MKKTEIVGATFFDGAHRGFGLFDQFHGAAAVIRVNADAKACGDAQVVAGHIVGGADGGKELFGNVLGLLGMLDVVEDQHKFVGAVTKHRIRLAHRRHQALADKLEHFIADRVAERIIDALEAVQADKHHG